MPDAVSLMTFNVNNLFLRYKFGTTFPGDMSGKSISPDPRWGYLPLFKPGLFEIFDAEQRNLAASAIWDGAGQQWPDVLCLQEVESMHALRAFNQAHLEGHYAHAVLLDGYDLRQIDVGILSKLPILNLRTHIDEPDPLDPDNPRLFSRDCVEIELALPDGRTLTVLNNHFKSKLVIESNPAKRAAKEQAARNKRQRQAQRVMDIVRERFAGRTFESELFAVVGDLNDQPGSPAVRPLLKNSGLENVLNRLPEQERWTGYYKSGGDVSQLDYLLLSPVLSQLSAGVLPTLERAGIGFRALNATQDVLPKQINLVGSETDEGMAIDFGFARYEGVTPKRTASDHCPLCIRFEV
jgi:endonuclease/exonuclease/phosphatase family metal-dependent hydrolase